jgi:hypothetical protein
MNQALLLTMFVGALSLQAQTKPQSLFETIRTLDTQLFDAYDHCDMEKFGAFLADDLEFYNDAGGLTRRREAVVEAVKNICGKVTRVLVPGSLEVYALKDFGAVEMGVHRYSSKDDTETVGEAKFIYIWQNQNGVWKITRMINIDRHSDASQ